MSGLDMVIIALNFTVSLMSAGWAALVVVDSGFRERAVGHLQQPFFMRLYVARALPIGIAAGIGPLAARGEGVAAVLLIAAAVQLLDVGVAIVERRSPLIVGAAFAAVVHLTSVPIVL